MLSDRFKWVVFFFMLFLGVSSLIAFIAAQYYLKTKSPDLWEQFFPGRSIGFAHDLHFHKFAEWINSSEGNQSKLDLPMFDILWKYYAVASKLVLLPFCILLVDFFLLCYKTGMIGGWKFR